MENTIKEQCLEAGEIKCSMLFPFLVVLIKQLRNEYTISKSDMDNIGPKIVSNITPSLMFDVGNTLYSTFLAYKIKEAFEVVFTDIKEIEEQREEPETSVEKKQTTEVQSTEEVFDTIEDFEDAQESQEDRDFLNGIRFTSYE